MSGNKKQQRQDKRGSEGKELAPVVAEEPKRTRLQLLKDWWGWVVSPVAAFGVTIAVDVVRIGCLVIAVAAASWAFHQTFAKKQLWKTGIVVVAFVVLAIAMFSIARYFDGRFARVEPTPSPVPSPEPNLAIFIKCDLGGMPLTIPAEGALRLVPVNENYMRGNSWGSYEIRNDESTPKQWPDKRKLEKAGKLGGEGRFLYKCAISNRGNVNVLDVNIPMRFWFGNKGGDENAVKFTPIVTPLDAGQTSALYFVNDCPTHATGILPEQVSLLVVGEKQKRTTQLHQPQRNIVDPIMFWFSTRTNWVGVTACK